MRKAMREVLGIKEMVIFQNEGSSNSHFHMWMHPKAEWMEGKMESVPLKSILDYAKRTSRPMRT